MRVDLNQVSVEEWINSVIDESGCKARMWKAQKGAS